jgi:hypothetical protein
MNLQKITIYKVLYFLFLLLGVLGLLNVIFKNSDGVGYSSVGVLYIFSIFGSSFVSIVTVIFSTIFDFFIISFILALIFKKKIKK